MTLILVVRTREGIAIVTDTVTTANTKVEMYGELTPVEYHIYNRRKLSQVGDFAVVHAGLSFLNGKTINQIVDRIPEHSHLNLKSLDSCIAIIKETFLKEINKEKLIEGWKRGSLILTIGVIGYLNEKPFVYRIVFFRSDEGVDDLLEIIESDDAFVEPYYGIDYFGDYEFVQLVIRAAKKENLMKPFDILTIHEALKLGRTLLAFLIEFQRFMVSFTVAFPIESAIITLEDGFQYIDKLEVKKFHYDHYE